MEKMLLILLCLSVIKTSSLANEDTSIQTPEIHVGKVFSTKTQIPYLFYEIGYCKDIVNPLYIKDTIGELLTGDKYADSPFIIKKTIEPIKACSMSISPEDIYSFRDYIDKEYYLTFYVNKLPIGTSLKENLGKLSYDIGVPLGFKKEGKYYIFNFFKFTIYYNESEDLIEKITRTPSARVVAGSVYPSGLKINEREEKVFDDFYELPYSNNNSYLKFDLFYEIEYKTTDIKYSSRWDFLLHSTDDNIHLKPIIISLILISVCSLWIIIVFLRGVGQDIERYNLQIVVGELNVTEKNWKQLAYDVFRAPLKRTMICAFIGTGIQTGLMTSTTLILGYLGFLNPEHRGYLINTLFISSIIFNCFSGYYSTRFYKLMNGENWLINLFFTALVFPTALLITGIICFVGFRLEGSSV